MNYSENLLVYIYHRDASRFTGRDFVEYITGPTSARDWFEGLDDPGALFRDGDKGLQIDLQDEYGNIVSGYYVTREA